MVFREIGKLKENDFRLSPKVVLFCTPHMINNLVVQVYYGGVGSYRPLAEGKGVRRAENLKEAEGIVPNCGISDEKPLPYDCRRHKGIAVFLPYPICANFRDPA